jgi:FAD/FMN-containing dehydrogenase
MTTTTPPDDETVRAFHDRVHGDVLHPGDEGYEAARTVFNAMIDKYPSYVVRATGAADVVAAVDFARDHDLPLAVKGGGHNFAGTAVCDDGLVIDCSRMDSVRVDPAARTARVGPGATWADVDHETQAFGLATTGGLVSHTGVAGLTLGGGQGYLARKHGLTIDNLRGADVVTADGELVHASEEEHPELFWALRGGGGNFGVVTSFEFQLYEVEEVFAGSLIYPHEEFHAVARSYREFVADAPPEARLLFGSMVLPAKPVFPEAVRDSRVAIVIACYVGSPEEGERVLAPLRERGDPHMDSLRRRPYTAFQRAGDSGGSMRTDLRSQYLATLPDGAIETMAEYAEAAPSAGATVFVSPRGGAETDPPSDATAYPHRDAAHHLLIEARWDACERDDEHVAWVREFHEAVRPYTTGAAAMNFLTDGEGRDRIRAAYGDNYDRLAEIKAEWDPENLFCGNQNVEPDG